MNVNTLYNRPVNGTPAVLFLISIIAVSFTYTNFLIDEALMGRFVVLSLCLLLVVVFTFRSGETDIKITLPVFFYVFYFLVNLFSIGWSISISEGLFESFRVFLGLSVFILTLYLFTDFFLAH